MIDIQNFTQLLAQNLAKYLALVVRVLDFHLNQSQLPFGIYKVHYQQGTDPLFHNGSAAMFISRKKLSNRVIEPGDGNFVPPPPPPPPPPNPQILYEHCFQQFYLWHPGRPRGSQSGREKGRNERFQVRAKEPLGTDSHRAISKNSSGCRLLSGHKKCFVLLCPISANSFSWVRTRRLLSRSRLVWLIHMHAVGKLSVWYKAPSHFKILSAQKLKTLFQKYKLELKTGIHACICHVLCKY